MSNENTYYLGEINLRLLVPFEFDFTAVDIPADKSLYDVAVAAFTKQWNEEIDWSVLRKQAVVTGLEVKPWLTITDVPTNAL